jgi:outer membrane receptor for ferrienterochelin and colicins
MKLIQITLIFLILIPTLADDILVIGEHEKEKHIEKGTTLSPFQTFKTENVSRSKLKDNSNQNLVDVLEEQVGVDAQTYCANCGAKRLSINGLKGEHSSILVDGLPLHSAVSSFYGVENIPIASLQDIHVMRGAGASLSNPEAIGGTLNLITQNPLDFTSSLGILYGIDDKFQGKNKNAQFLAGMSDEKGKWGFYFSGQMARTDTWDVDNNNVAEIPQREIQNIMTKGRLLWNKWDISARGGIAQLEMLGGYKNPNKPETVRALSAGERDFVDGDVNKTYIGEPDKITDWIEVKRKEVAFKALYNHSEKLDLLFNIGYANQEQSSIYMHGFDYANNDSIVVGDFSSQYKINNGIFKSGLFAKDQRLRAESLSLFNRDNTPRDNFDFLSTAAYLSYTHFLDNWEFDLAIRGDHINLRWHELANKIDKTIFAPRFQLMNFLGEHLTQRFSYGVGYRAPLTFFESQHGNSESGYLIDIDKMEKSHSFVYSLSYNTPSSYITFGTHYTRLQNMAYGIERPNQKILYLNDIRDYDITVTDLLFGFELNHDWLLESSIELFHYPGAYKERLPTAAIEERIMLKSVYSEKRWGQTTKITIIPSRDISGYGYYQNHFQTRNEGAEPYLAEGLIKKGQKAPTFATLDVSVFYNLLDKTKVSFSIDNVFDYTQAKEGDSPSTWHWHFNHAHYDGLHTWGPNQGRSFNLALNMTF